VLLVWGSWSRSCSRFFYFFVCRPFCFFCFYSGSYTILGLSTAPELVAPAKLGRVYPLGHRL